LIDVFSRMIVGWQLATHMRTDLVLDALRMASGLDSPAPTSDWCSTPTKGRSTRPRTTRKRSTVIGCWRRSAGSVGDCFDNALAESFVDSYKTELIADRVWRTHAQFEHATVSNLGWLTTAGCTPRSGTDRLSSTNASTGRGSRSGSNRVPLRPPPTVTDLRGVRTVASPTGGSEQ
jgi:transposase InsO family protein